ncbi:MAG: phage tail protein [Bacteroidota bacterium]
MITSFRFSVDFLLPGGIIPIHFSEVSGLSVNVETEAIKEGGQNEYIQKLPTHPQYPNLILKKAISVDMVLAHWIKTAIANFDFSPVPLTVSILNEKGIPLVNWIVSGAYPVKWEASNLQADQSNLVIETLEMAYQQFYII